jgi:hypothetical protein
MAPVNNGQYRPPSLIPSLRKPISVSGRSASGNVGGGRSEGVGGSSRVEREVTATSVAYDTFAPRIAPDKDTISVNYALVLRMMAQLRKAGSLARNLLLSGNFHDAAAEGPTEFFVFEEGQLAAACIAVSPQGFWTTQAALPVPAKVTRRTGQQGRQESEDSRKKRRPVSNKVRALAPGTVTQ